MSLAWQFKTSRESPNGEETPRSGMYMNYIYKSEQWAHLCCINIIMDLIREARYCLSVHHFGYVIPIASLSGPSGFGHWLWQSGPNFLPTCIFKCQRAYSKYRSCCFLYCPMEKKIRINPVRKAILNPVANNHQIRAEYDIQFNPPNHNDIHENLSTLCPLWGDTAGQTF